MAQKTNKQTHKQTLFVILFDLLFNKYTLVMMRINASRCPLSFHSETEFFIFSYFIYFFLVSLCIRTCLRQNNVELHPLKCPDREPHISINTCTVTQIKYKRKGRTFLSIWYFKAVDLTSSFGKRIKNYARITMIHCLLSNIL